MDEPRFSVKQFEKRGLSKLSCVDKRDADPNVKQNREPTQYPQGADRQQEVLS